MVNRGIFNGEFEGGGCGLPVQTTKLNFSLTPPSYTRGEEEKERAQTYKHSLTFCRNSYPRYK